MGGAAFARKIIECIKNTELDKLSAGAVRRYKELLNWNVWSEKVHKELDKLLNANDVG